MKPSMLVVIVVGAIVSLIIILMIVAIINHSIKMNRERIAFPPPGEMVQIGGKTIHVYVEGDGETTLVFLAGHGTSCPTLDFKPLWGRLVDQHRIVVVEKSGYGWSQVSESPRDLETILEETRKALEITGVKGPFVLVPHSMSGLEAIYWAQKYPDEVKAIIGLDPSVPETYDLLPQPNDAQLGFLHFISKIGLTRLMPEAELSKNLPLMDSDDLSEEEKKKYKAMFFRSTLTKDMLREVEYLEENSRIVGKGEIPKNTPMYFFISQQQDQMVKGWEDALLSYLSNINYKDFVKLDTGHYVHHEKAELIAKELKIFLSEID
ncbi:MAG: alpha/beta hydrolase [Gudongella sp.]|nr:alpha/beta hydrolase [Gudongella sp.]